MALNSGQDLTIQGRVSERTLYVIERFEEDEDNRYFVVRDLLR